MFKNIYEEEYKEKIDIQVFAKELITIDTDKIFLWIFDHKDFNVKDIIELEDYDMNIDEETNANSIIKIVKYTTATANDIIAIKKNNEVVYWGMINEIQNEKDMELYTYTLKYITNIFNQNVKLQAQELIRAVGIEDFIAKTITDNFISSTDTFINRTYLQIKVKTHTIKQTNVSNVQNEIYNLHTWMTNCTQNYDIVYNFSIVNKKLVLTIENKEYEKELIDVQAQSITDCTEVFETDIVSKVTVLYDKTTGVERKGEYILYLLNDRTTTTDMNNKNRAAGKVEFVHTENYEDAQQKALDTLKSNSYNHNITFKFNKYIKVGTPIAIKTKKSLIYDTYISAIKFTKNKLYEYTCGNIRINLIDKLLKERGK